MAAHIVTLLEEVSAEAISPAADFSKIIELLRAIGPELELLKAEDFPPNERGNFIKARNKFMPVSRISHGTIVELCRIVTATAGPLIPILKLYGISSATVTQFTFMRDAGLRSIAERDYAELTRIVFPGKAWKSAVVLAGSILEAILFDGLQDPSNFHAAVSAKSAPREKGQVRDLKAGDWKLYKLIEVAEEIGILQPHRTKLIDQALRDHRNFVHPKKELQSGYKCTETQAQIAVAGLKSVLEHFGFTP